MFINQKLIYKIKIQAKDGSKKVKKMKIVTLLRGKEMNHSEQ